MIQAESYFLWCIVAMLYLIMFATWGWLNWLPRLRIMQPFIRLFEALSYWLQRLVDRIANLIFIKDRS